MNKSTYFLCLVGKKTHKSGWVACEINKAVALKKKIVAVKINRSNTTPDELYGVGASWALSFKFESITQSINKA
ncbi:MAG: TIR domain-containing protein [Coraliomargaritaceae bacterium]